MSERSNFDVSDEPQTLQRLNEQQKHRLTEILDDYLSRMEAGERPERSRLIEQHPDLREALLEYLDKLDELNRFMGGESYSPEIIGKQLGDYRLIREIGRGGMGVVYLAQQISLDRQVAIKLLPFASLLEPKYIERFKNEAKAAAQLEHPNIVPVYSIGHDSGIHYYAMRYIEGQSLDQAIAISRETQTVGEAPRWTMQELSAVLQQFAEVAEALHRAHEYGVVHRDIKPSNLLRDNRNKLWLADFGLARFQHERELTRTGEMIGTMRYMSPEQALGKNELVDHRTDIYSLGATLYETLTLRPAVVGTEGPGLLRSIESDTPVRPRKLCPTLPVDVQTLIEKAMAKYRDDRYQSASLLAQDLRRASGGYPILANPLSPLIVARRWADKHLRLLAATMAFATVLMLGLIVSIFLIDFERRLARESLQKQTIFYQQARHAVEDLGVNSVEELAMIPGAELALQNQLRRILVYYQEFVAKATGDPNAKMELALTFSRMGTLVEKLESPQVAIKHYQRAKEIYDKEDLRRSLSPNTQQQRAENLNATGLARMKLGEIGAAEKDFENALAIQTKIANGLDAPSDIRVDIALSQNNLGLLLQRKGDTNQSVRLISTSIETLRDISQKDPKNIRVRRGLALALNNAANLQLQVDPQSAERLLQEALDIQLDNGQASNRTLRASLDLVATFNNLGSVALSQNDWRKAEAYNRKAISISRELVKLSPKVELYQQDLAFALNNLGVALREQGSSQDAKDAIEEAVHLQTALSQNSQNPSVLSGLGSSWNNLALLRVNQGQLSDGRQAFETGIQIQQKALAHSPKSDMYRQNLGKTLANLTGLLRQLKDREGELQILRARRELWSASPDRMIALAEEIAPMAASNPQFWDELIANLRAAKLGGYVFHNDFWERPNIRPLVQQLKPLIQP